MRGISRAGRAFWPLAVALYAVAAMAAGTQAALAKPPPPMPPRADAPVSTAHPPAPPQPNLPPDTPGMPGSTVSPPARPGGGSATPLNAPMMPPGLSGAGPAAPTHGAETKAPVNPADAHRPVPITFRALLTDEGPILQSGVVWRVYSNGGQKLLGIHRDAHPVIALTPGNYLVNAAYGLSNLTREIDVKPGQAAFESFVLNTGALELTAELVNSQTITGNIRFQIQSDEQDQFGHRRTVLDNVKPGRMIRLNAGAYHIVSTYGDANAIVRADVTVEPGKLTIATVKLAAAPVTLKLVQSPGGEALADTQWTILTPTGDVVTKGAGALPTHIFAAGDYAVVAKHDGLSYTRKFTVQSGAPEQVEVLVQNGPSSPEALKAITNPPPQADNGYADSDAVPQTPQSSRNFIFTDPGSLLHDSVP